MKLYELYLLESFPLAKKEFISSGYDSTDVDRVITDYQKFLKQPGFVDEEYNDINYWRKHGFSELKKYIDLLHKRVKSNQRIKDQAKDFLTIDDTETYRLVVPLSHSASCDQGKRSTWCTSHPGQPMFAQYFYSQEDILVYVISKSNYADNFAIRYNSYGDVMEIRDLLQNLSHSDAAIRLYTLHRIHADDLYHSVTKYLDSIREKRSSNSKVDLSNAFLNFMKGNRLGDDVDLDQLDFYVAHQIKRLLPVKRDDDTEMLDQYFSYVRMTFEKGIDKHKAKLFDSAVMKDDNALVKYMHFRTRYPYLEYVVPRFMALDNIDRSDLFDIISSMPPNVDLTTYPAYHYYQQVGRGYGVKRNSEVEKIITQHVKYGFEYLTELILDDQITKEDFNNSDTWQAFQKKVYKEGDPNTIVRMIKWAGFDTVTDDALKTVLTDITATMTLFHKYYRDKPWEAAEPIIYSDLRSAVMYHTAVYGYERANSDLSKYLKFDGKTMKDYSWDEYVSNYCRYVIGSKLPAPIERQIIKGCLEYFDDKNSMSLYKYRNTVYGDDKVFGRFIEMAESKTMEESYIDGIVSMVFIAYGNEFFKYDLSDSKFLDKLFSGKLIRYNTKSIGRLLGSKFDIGDLKISLDDISREFLKLWLLYGGKISSDHDTESTQIRIYHELRNRDGVANWFSDQEINKVCEHILGNINKNTRWFFDVLLSQIGTENKVFELDEHVLASLTADLSGVISTDTLRRHEVVVVDVSYLVTRVNEIFSNLVGNGSSSISELMSILRRFKNELPPKTESDKVTPEVMDAIVNGFLSVMVGNGDDTTSKKETLRPEAVNLLRTFGISSDAMEDK